MSLKDALDRMTCQPGCSCHGSETIIGYLNPDGSHQGDYVAGAPGGVGGAVGTSGSIFHDGSDGCGFRWDAHDTRNPLFATPFGCPDEAAAREEWGR
jgi:hypothetical protein